MKRFLIGAILAVALAAPMAACTTTGTVQLPAQVLQATKLALTTYADVFQPAVITYGRLPDCPAAALCKDRAILNKLKAADAAVTKTVVAVQPVLDGKLPDSGQVADALTAITSAEAAIAASPALAAK